MAGKTTAFTALSDAVGMEDIRVISRCLKDEDLYGPMMTAHLNKIRSGSELRSFLRAHNGAYNFLIQFFARNHPDHQKMGTSALLLDDILGRLRAAVSFASSVIPKRMAELDSQAISVTDEDITETRHVAEELDKLAGQFLAELRKANGPRTYNESTLVPNQFPVAQVRRLQSAKRKSISPPGCSGDDPQQQLQNLGAAAQKIINDEKIVQQGRDVFYSSSPSRARAKSGKIDAGPRSPSHPRPLLVSQQQQQQQPPIHSISPMGSDDDDVDGDDDDFATKKLSMNMRDSATGLFLRARGSGGGGGGGGGPDQSGINVSAIESASSSKFPEISPSRLSGGGSTGKSEQEESFGAVLEQARSPKAIYRAPELDKQKQNKNKNDQEQEQVPEQEEQEGDGDELVEKKQETDSATTGPTRPFPRNVPLSKKSSGSSAKKVVGAAGAAARKKKQEQQRMPVSDESVLRQREKRLTSGMEFDKETGEFFSPETHRFCPATSLTEQQRQVRARENKLLLQQRRQQDMESMLESGSGYHGDGAFYQQDLFARPVRNPAQALQFQQQQSRRARSVFLRVPPFFLMFVAFCVWTVWLLEPRHGYESAEKFCFVAGGFLLVLMPIIWPDLIFVDIGRGKAGPGGFEDPVVAELRWRQQLEARRRELAGTDEIHLRQLEKIDSEYVRALQPVNMMYTPEHMLEQQRQQQQQQYLYGQHQTPHMHPYNSYYNNAGGGGGGWNNAQQVQNSNNNNTNSMNNQNQPVGGGSNNNSNSSNVASRPYARYPTNTTSSNNNNNSVSSGRPPIAPSQSRSNPPMRY